MFGATPDIAAMSFKRAPRFFEPPLTCTCFLFNVYRPAFCLDLPGVSLSWRMI